MVFLVSRGCSTHARFYKELEVGKCQFSNGDSARLSWFAEIYKVKQQMKLWVAYKTEKIL